jgi:two-component sensor histidine kinase
LYKTFNDSLFNEAKSRQIAQLQIQFETEEKEQNIQLLTRQALLQKTTLQHTQLVKNVYLGGTVMLLLLLGLGFNRYRLKQRNNRKLEAQQKEINFKNESLNRLLKEKEWLMKEMHHRVKNNLQIIVSLLNTQSLYLNNNEAAYAAIRESQHRMQAISLIHQKLYRSENMATVSMPDYIFELTDYLKDSFDISPRIMIEQDIEAMELDVSLAIPVGLILNETITNAIKYAFPGGRKGIIRLVMKKTDEDLVLLTISDNGIGLDSKYDNGKSSSLGMNLVNGLTDQLGGQFTMASDNGVTIKIEFPRYNG